MTADILKLVPNEIGADFRFDADAVLESMKGKSFTGLLVFGLCEDGSVDIQGNCNAGEALVIMIRAARELVFGDDE